jgi:G3E family GTPase
MAYLDIKEKIPVTIVGGYLGSGKTTLINFWMKGSEKFKYAVLVNDFGQINIDEVLLSSGDGLVIGLSGGCICCSIGSDLMSALDQLSAYHEAIDGVVLEVSGVGLPKAISAAVELDGRYRSEDIVCVVDSNRVGRQIKDPHIGDTVRAQLGQSSSIFMSKLDLLDAQAREKARALVEQLAPDRRWLSHCDVPGSMEAREVNESSQDFDAAKWFNPVPQDFASESFELAHAIEEDSLRDFLKQAGRHLLRIKGIFQLTSGKVVLLQGANDFTDICEWRGTWSGVGRLVYIHHRDWTESLNFKRELSALIETSL